MPYRPFQRPLAASLAITLLGLCLFVGSGRNAYGQDGQFSHFFALPALYNPAHTGGNQGSRGGFQLRNQWFALQPTLLSYNAGYEHYIAPLNSGVGGYFVQNRVGPSASQTAVAQYAYQLRLNRQWSARFGANGGVRHRSISFLDLTFPDQVSLRGPNQPSADPASSGQQGRWMPTFGAGGLLYSPKLWLGVSLQHLNRPNQAVAAGSDPLPIRWSISGGYKLFARSPNGRPRPEYFLFPSFLYKHQGPFDQLDVGLFGRYKVLTAGFFYRGLPLKSNAGGALNQDALVAMVGLRTHYFRVSYSYDLTLSPLFNPALGSHEISLVVEWGMEGRELRGPLGGRRPVRKRRF